MSILFSLLKSIALQLVANQIERTIFGLSRPELKPVVVRNDIVEADEAFRRTMKRQDDFFRRIMPKL